MIKEVLVSFMVATTAVESPEVDKFRLTEATCLAKNMYFEARNQGLAGQLAVSLVVMNRVKDERFPNTICGVIEQERASPISKWWLKEKGKIVPIRNRCQFSWFCDGKSDDPKEPTTYGRLLDISKDLVYGHLDVVDFTEGATHYHADYVYPAWRKQKKKTVEVADHIFYRWEK